MDSGCSNHMTNYEEKLSDILEYKGERVVLMTNNSRLPITDVGKVVIAPHSSPQ